MTQVCEAVYEKEVLKPNRGPDDLSGGQTDKVAFDDLKPEIVATPEEILELFGQVYDGWSKKEVEEFEALILDRSNFRKRN